MVFKILMPNVAIKLRKVGYTIPLLCILVAGAIPILPFSRARYDRPHVTISDISATPQVFAGDMFNQTFTLTNVGSKTAKTVRLILDVKYPFALVNSSYNIFVGDMRKDWSRSVTIQISIDRKTLVGLYYIAFIIEYENTEGESYIHQNTFSVQVFGRPKINIQETVIDQSPSKISAGENFRKVLSLNNVGIEDAKMVQLSLNVSYPFALTSSSSNLLIGDLGIGENRSIAIEISVDRNAVGVYSIPFIIQYEDSYGWIYKKLGNFGVEVLGKSRMIIDEAIIGYGQSRIFIGETFTRTFNLTNVGNYDAKRVQVSYAVSYPFALISSSSNLLIGDLGVGESGSVSVEFSVDRNAEIGVYSIPYIIKYENAYGESLSKSGVFGVDVIGIPQLLIDEINIDPSILTAGNNGLMSVKLTNIGTDIAHDTSLRIFGGKGILSSSFAYIAKIDKKKTESIIFPISIDNSLKPGNYLFNLTILHTDYLNNTYHLAELYEFKILPKSSIIPSFYMGAIVIVAILVSFGYLMYVWNPVDLSTDVDTLKSPKKKHSRRRYVLLLISIISMYVIIFPIPYLVHNNLDNAGIVTYAEDVPMTSLPKSIQEICKLRGISKPTIQLVKHVEPEWVTLVVSSLRYPIGSAVEMTDFIVEWYVDWRDFNFAERDFQKLVISNIKELDAIESFVEKMLLVQERTIGVYDLSRVTFYGGPILFVLCLTILVQKRLALWNLPALFSCYSFQIWCLNILAYKHHLTVSIEWEYFGYLFIVLIPLSIYAWHFERSIGGRSAANKMKALSQILGLIGE